MGTSFYLFLSSQVTITRNVPLFVDQPHTQARFLGANRLYSSSKHLRSPHRLVTRHQLQLLQSQVQWLETVVSEADVCRQTDRPPTKSLRMNEIHRLPVSTVCILLRSMEKASSTERFDMASATAASLVNKDEIWLPNARNRAQKKSPMETE